MAIYLDKATIEKTQPERLVSASLPALLEVIVQGLRVDRCV